jgi:AsmA protein
MKPAKHKLVRRLFALGVVAFLIVGALSPVFLGEHSGLHRAGYAEASNRHTVSISTPVFLFERPLLLAERAEVSLVLPDGRALNDQEIAQRLQSGEAELLIEDAKLTFDATGLNPARVATIPDKIKSILDPLRDFRFASIAVRDAKLMLDTAAGGGSLLGRLSCDIVKAGADQLHVKGTLERDGVKLPFEVSLNTKAANTAAGRLPLTAKIAGELVTASLTGEYLRGDAFALNASQASIMTPNAKALIGWMNETALAGNGLGDLRISGPLEWRGGTMTFENAKVSIDGNEATGGLSVSVGGNRRPMFDGTLAFENLELAPYMQPRQSSALAGLSQSAWDWPRWLGGDPASGSLIRHVDADLRLSANSVTSGGALLGRGAASITVKDDKLQADLAEIELDEQAQGNARLTVDLSGTHASYAVRGMLESTDLVSVTRIFTDRDVVSGGGRLDIDLKSVGNTDDEIRSSLSGSATLAMPQGGQIAFDLTSLIATAKAGGLGWDKLSAGKTSLESLSAKLQANNGVLTAKTVQAQTPTRNVEVAGTIDLTARMVDLSIAASPNPATGKPEANERLRIRGPLLAPVIKSEAMSKAALTLPQPN